MSEASPKSSVVRLEQISKRFGNVTALDRVTVEVEARGIHAIVGENGAGKSTLMKVLYGAHAPDEGQIVLDGAPVRFRSSAEALKHGVGMVSQHYGIVPELTCLENLVLGAEGGFGRNLRAQADRAEHLATKMGFQFDWNQDATHLSPAGAQKLEILKLLWREARIMILDEPTAMLSPADGEALFISLNQLVAEGATVLLVTHRLPEVIDHCRHVTVLRAGQRVADLPVNQTDARQLAEWIVGSPLTATTHARQTPVGEPVLGLRGLRVRGDRGDEAVKGVDLEVRAGEIVGVAGVDGSGQRELFHAVMGTRPAFGGMIELTHQDVTTLSTSERIRRGVRLIPEDRHEEGVVEDWSLELNGLLGLQRQPEYGGGKTIQPATRKNWAEQVANKFKTRHGGLHLPIRSLSGGNQQRFVAARATESDPVLILAFQPARGLDLKGTADVYAAIRERCDQGAAALVVSFDLDELLEHCDRLVAMNGGNLETPSAAESKDRQAIGRLIVGAQ